MLQFSPYIFISLVLCFSVICLLSDLTPLALTPKSVPTGVPLPGPGSERPTVFLLLLEKWGLLYQVICSKSKLESLMPPFPLLPCVSGSALIKYSSTTPGPKGAPSSRRVPRLSLCSLNHTFLFNLNLFFWPQAIACQCRMRNFLQSGPLIKAPRRTISHSHKQQMHSRDCKTLIILWSGHCMLSVAANCLGQSYGDLQ